MYDNLCVSVISRLYIQNGGFPCDAPSSVSQVPNQLNIVADRGNRNDRRRYQQARRLQVLYEAAARLWAQGVNMADAVNIVDSAMRDAGEV